jgi:hypothetical protein
VTVSTPTSPTQPRDELATAVAMFGEMGMAFRLPEAERDLAAAPPVAPILPYRDVVTALTASARTASPVIANADGPTFP